MLAVFYENEIAGSMIIVLRILEFFVLMVYIIPTFKDVIKDKKQLLLFLFIGLVDVYLFRLLLHSDFFYEISFSREMLMYLHIIFSIILMMVVSSYCFGHGTRASYMLLIFIFSFVFSDFFAALGYYMNNIMFQFTAEVLYVLSIGCYSYFVLIPEDEYLANLYH